ncbi:hypothetical protein E2C01_007324 [Portunus trituberculatus]|uniref:Uncharacterized protein n=1 Tax=Portunus trituberculatus TaxID=210409 RepID=A0A5B7D249_PORTR|nr:hypothetical protein [Portunus trituberculatus]
MKTRTIPLPQDYPFPPGLPPFNQRPKPERRLNARPGAARPVLRLALASILSPSSYPVTSKLRSQRTEVEA